MKVDLEDLAQVWSDSIPELDTRLMQLFPNLGKPQAAAEAVKYSAKRPPLTREQLADGEPLCHVVQHVALELQRMAGMPVYWGKSYPAREEGVEFVVFTYQEERAGRAAAEAAVDIVDSLCHGRKVNIQPIINELHEIREDEFFGPSTWSIVSEAASRNIPYIQLKNTSIIQLGYGVNQKRIQATTSSNTAFFSVEIAGNKNRTKAMLHDAGVPVPRGTTVYSPEGL
ncbi:MAG TPA: cyanophycin synthetase, partial [Hymenobacter sp.]